MEKIQIPSQTPRSKKILATIPYKNSKEIIVTKFIMSFFIIGGIVGAFITFLISDIPKIVPFIIIIAAPCYGLFLTKAERKKIVQRKQAIINGKFYKGIVVEHNREWLAWSKRWKPVYTASVKFTTKDQQEVTKKISKYFYPGLHTELPIGTSVDLLFDQKHYAVFFPYEINTEINLQDN